MQESTIYRRRERLSRLTDGLGLGDVYGATIQRINAQGGDKSRLGMGALMWISHAEQPLRADELCYALAIELGSTDFNAGNIPSITTLVGCCHGLITVDKEASTTRLIHFTLKEYLSAHPDIFSRPHSAMAEICLTYLNSKQIKALPADSYSDSQGTFLEYCSLYWGAHAKRELSGHSISLALQLLQEYNGHISAQFLLRSEDSLRFEYPNHMSRFPGLHCASFFGIVEIVVALTETGCCDVRGEDFRGYTPLTWAAWKGHEELVKILLEEVDPDMPDDNGRTPFSHAAEGGRELVLKTLLGRPDIEPDKPDHHGRTPLSHAAQWGQVEVVILLLGRQEVDPDIPDNDGRTPLSHAAEWGQVEVVRLLLEREEVDPDGLDSVGRTPFSHAAFFEQEEVVILLLGRADIEPDKPDDDGRTPLSYAANCGNVGIVEILLGLEVVDPDMPDDYGRTPLSYAAEEGREEVVELLLGREDIEPDRPADDGRTPLSYAAGDGREEVVELLLGCEEINPDKPDNDGRTPLSYAAGSSCHYLPSSQFEPVVEILLEQEINPDKPDNDGRTPLSHAASCGREGIVKILLRRNEVTPDRPDSNGRTPLSHAAGDFLGHMPSDAFEAVVRTLLEREEVNPDTPDNDGRTPLSHATRRRNDGVAKILSQWKPSIPASRKRRRLNTASVPGYESLSDCG